MVFQQIVEKQKNLMAHYLTIGAIPNYPVDIHSKQGQKTIKGFIYNIGEELGEANEAYEDSLISFENNLPSQGKELLVLHNEEVADVIHFVTELVILMGYDQNLPDLIRMHTPEPCLKMLPEGRDPFHMLLVMGDYYNFMDTWMGRSEPKNCFSPNGINSLDIGNYRVSQYNQQKLMKLSYLTLHHAFKLGNALKSSREWKQSEEAVKIPEVEKELANLLAGLFRYLAFGEFTTQNILAYYIKKNNMNLQRIKEKY